MAAQRFKDGGDAILNEARYLLTDRWHGVLGQMQVHPAATYQVVLASQPDMSADQD